MLLGKTKQRKEEDTVTLEEKETYLLKTNYSAKDVMFLLGIGKTQATKVMNECRVKYGGAVMGRKNIITTNSFWLREGTTREEELRVIAYAKGYGKELHERDV